MTETVQVRVPQEEIEEALKEVIDPELGVNIVDLGLLYGLRWDEDGTLTGARPTAGNGHGTELGRGAPIGAQGSICHSA